jgi:hypothetical protein
MTPEQVYKLATIVGNFLLVATTVGMLLYFLGPQDGI